jgi:hypothetical protein
MNPVLHWPEHCLLFGYGIWTLGQKAPAFEAVGLAAHTAGGAGDLRETHGYSSYICWAASAGEASAAEASGMCNVVKIF